MLFNVAFLITYRDLALDVSIWDQLLSLAYGLKLDVSLTGYILGIPTLVLILFSIFKSGFLKKILSVYTILILISLIMVYSTNLVIYGFWNTPLSRSIFDYISTPGEMMASLPTWQLILIFGMIIIVIYALHQQVYKRWISGVLVIPAKRDWVTAAIFCLLLPALILPIRGGLATSPIQTGSVYFHQNAYINHSAVNPAWNLLYTLVESKKLTMSLDFYPDQEVQAVMDELYDDVKGPLPVLNTKSPNIILIFLESFAQYVVYELGGKGEAAPNFNKLVEEGIFFTNFISSGTMTDRALGAVLGGYPGLPGTCIIYYEDKAQKLPNLNLALKTAGYSSSFLYGGDIDFAHIRSFMVMSGFDNIVSDNDFSRDIPRSSWGVPDHVIFPRLLEEADNASTPFFQVTLTLSSHTPFDVPMETAIPGSGREEKYLNSIYYTDRYLGEFIETAKTRDWWDETLIILMADHGCRVGNIAAYEPKRASIPMLWLGGALAVKDTMITKHGSQTDLSVTLLNQLDLPGGDFRFSKDLLSGDAKSFSYYCFNDGITFSTDSSYTVYSLITGDYIGNYLPDDPGATDPGLAYLDYLITDFNNK